MLDRKVYFIKGQNTFPLCLTPYSREVMNMSYTKEVMNMPYSQEV